MKGVGAEHQMLMSATSICECEHSHLYVSLVSARQGRATPFKKRKSPPLEEEKRLKPEKTHPGPDSFKEMKRGQGAQPNMAATQTRLDD